MDNLLNIIIIGGKAAGPKTAAVVARRLPDATITLFQKEERASYASCGLPYYASGDIASYENLTLTPYGVPKTPDFYKYSKGFDFVPGAEVTDVDREKKTVHGRIIRSGEVFEHKYDKLVLTTGSVPVEPTFHVANSPRIRHFSRPDDAVNFRQAAQEGKISKAVIIGGGYLGCELAESAGGLWGIDTVLIEKEKTVLPFVLDPEISEIVMRELARKDIHVMTDCTVERIDLDIDENPVVRLHGGDNILADYVFLCLGLRPNVALAEKCGLQLGQTGAIIVDSHMRTSDPDIYAGGDCVESVDVVTGRKLHIPSASLANRQGRVIAENLGGNEVTFPGITNALLLKVFETNVGAVGLTESQANKAGLKTRSAWGTFVDKPDYYPEPKRFTLKMVYSPDDDRLLGLQAAGPGDICRRIDVFSTFLLNKGTLEDLFRFEHGYAPPYSEPIDPLHEMAGIAMAQKRGLQFLPPAMDTTEDSFWLDVRETEEAYVSPWPLQEEFRKEAYVNIPLNDLRSSLAKLDKSKKIIIICGRGARSYQAALILQKAGFENICIVGGGTLAVMG
jgi:NADPH-dependent 2,4-dienoyl-CoA reductase/sulfur reductase-like enzyme/rhodanese-related sulfurtransferase